MEIVMGEESYNAAYRAKQIIAFLIKAEFDDQYGRDAFTIDDLYDTATELYRFQTIPQASPAVEKGLAKIVPEENESDEGFEATMSAVFTRLDKLRENSHVYQMLNQCPEWDSEREQYVDECLHFRDLVDKDVQVLFDLGRLRKRTQRAFTLILLSSLWDDVQWRGRSEGSTDTQVNLIIEEAAQIASKPLVYEQLIPQARAFGLSMGLVMQFPSQVKDVGGRRPYNEIMNNVQNKIYGKIEKPDDRLDEAISVDEILPEAVANKLKHMKPGEWIADLSARFGDEVTTPFSIQALDVPSGHPEGDDPLQNINEFKLEYQSTVEDTIERFGTDRSEVPDVTLDGDDTDPTEDSDRISPVPPNRFDKLNSLEQVFQDIDPSDQVIKTTEPNNGDSTGNEDGADDINDDSGPQYRTFSDQHCESCGKFMQAEGEVCEECQNERSHVDQSEQTDEKSPSSDDESNGIDPIMGAGDVEAVDRDIPDYNNRELQEKFDTVQSEDTENELQQDDGANPETPSNKTTKSVDTESEGESSTTESTVENESVSDNAVNLAKADLQTLDDVTSLARKINNQFSGDERIAKLGQLQLKASESVMEIPMSQLKEIGSGGSASTAERGEEIGVENGSESSNTDDDGQYEADDRCTECGKFINYGKEYCDDCREENDTDSRHLEENSIDSIPEYAAPVTDAEREEYGLSSEDIQFLSLVADAYHRRLEDYSLLDSMAKIRDRAGNPDIDHLMEVGLIEKANSRQIYYNLTPEAWDLIEVSPHSAGDWREKILHRVGVVITEKLLLSRDDVDKVEPYYQVDAETVIDIAAFDKQGDLCHVGEIEMFSWNKEAVLEDYEKLAESNANSIWVTENRKSLSKVLNDLDDQDILPEEIGWSSKQTLSDLNEDLQKHPVEGMNEAYTFEKARKSINGDD
jgi:hypothetical protein